MPVLATNTPSRTIHTGFDVRLLGDAVRSLKCARLVIDVQPNQRGKTDGRIFQKPDMLNAEQSPNIRWVIMPVSIEA